MKKKKKKHLRRNVLMSEEGQKYIQKKVKNWTLDEKGQPVEATIFLKPDNNTPTN